jgi:hypothetical protein
MSLWAKYYGTNNPSSSATMATSSNLETFWRDARYGARMLRKSPSFVAAVTVTLAVGIGANTVIFSVVNSVLLKPLPFKDPNQPVIIWKADTKNRAISTNCTKPQVAAPHLDRHGLDRDGVPSGSQVTGDPFIELSRASAMRIATAVTRPTMVASAG